MQFQNKSLWSFERKISLMRLYQILYTSEAYTQITFFLLKINKKNVKIK